MTKATVAPKALLVVLAIVASAAASSCSSNSSAPTCDQAGATSCNGEAAARLHPGCCGQTACPGSYTDYSYCGDGCGHSWYEFGSTEFGPCNTGDTACLTNLQQEVSNACNSGSSGSGSGTGGTSSSGSGGGSGMACGFLYPTACASCVMTNCCSASQTCASDPACVSLNNCVVSCNGNTTCQNTCGSNSTQATVNEFNAGQACLHMSCAAAGC